MSTESLPLFAARGASRCTVPGRGFKAKVDGKWQDYSLPCQHFLLEAFEAGCPSMRLHVKGNMYKFDFKKMEQHNLNTLEVCELKAPHNANRPKKSAIFDKENFKHPLSKGRRSLQGKIRPQRPVFVVRVPAGSLGKTIQVPHPKKLGKSMNVAVPANAKVGQPLYLPMPRTKAQTKVKYAVAGTALGTTSTAAAVAITEATGLSAGAVAGGGAAAVGTLAAASLGGVAIAGALVAAGAGVHYATRNPKKAIAIGALTLGALALADHVAEVGVLEAAGDVAEGAGDLVEGAGDVMEGVVDFGEDAGEFLLDAGEWVGDVAEDGVDIILDLF
jgi:hypothetical protein